MAQYKFKFSVIMPIYNVGQYLSDAIESVINQTIGFKENIQLILVNDGSTDNCDIICKEYAEKFTENVVYVRQENSGVSSARNAGIPYIEGKYVNFFDSDDVWELDVFEKVWFFFEAHKDEIHVACCKAYYFEAKEGAHNSNLKFNAGDRIIDVRKTPQYLLLNVTTAFIFEGTVRGETFDERIKIGEDSKFITKIILEKEKYGVLDSAVYRIRKRNDGSSLTQRYDIGRYTSTIDYYYKYMFEYSIEKYGKLIPYIQHVVLNGLKYRVLEMRKDFITEEQWGEYVKEVIELIKVVDDEVIAKTNRLTIFTRLFLLKLKYGIDAAEELCIVNGKFQYRETLLSKVPQKVLEIEKVDFYWRKMVFSGTVKIPINDNIKLYVKEKDGYKQVETSVDSNSEKMMFNGEKVARGYRFRVSLKRKIEEVSFYIGCHDEYIKVLSYRPNEMKEMQL